jgi:hypothetical protein
VSVIPVRSAVTGASARLAEVLVDPLQDQIGDLQVVSDLHDPVAVGADAAGGRVEHLRIAACRIHAADHFFAKTSLATATAVTALGQPA